jgi:glycosyltransferase involved in cell wall biosynthesis
MIAFHYPPLKGSSGIQRTLKFSTYIREHGWSPIVLSAHPRSYNAVSQEQMAEIPSDVVVRRAFAVDVSRLFAKLGRYPRFLALPDRWSSWWAGGASQGLQLIKEFRPQLIWSTFPIATAHLIAWTLSRWSGLPWVADFRDSMTEEGFPSDPMVRRAYRCIERQTVENCSAAVFTTPGARVMYARRYPELPPERWRVIPNGYDEENFSRAESAPAADSSPARRLTLVHSGLLYPSERDPRPFFEALSALKRSGRIAASDLSVVLRASGHDALYAGLIANYGIADLVELAPALPYQAALEEMLSADGLLLFQAANCNHQIPAKIYEYLRAMRPIFALTDPGGDTAGLLKSLEIRSLAKLDDAADISLRLMEFLDAVRRKTCPIADRKQVMSFSRRRLSGDLAALFDGLVA